MANHVQISKNIQNIQKGTKDYIIELFTFDFCLIALNSCSLCNSSSECSFCMSGYFLSSF